VGYGARGGASGKAIDIVVTPLPAASQGGSTFGGGGFGLPFGGGEGGGVPMVPAKDGIHYWKATDQYGSEPEKIAHAITCEWIDQGSPNPPVWDGLAFALQSYLDGPENRRDWPKPQIDLPG
jgi:hypothetical protein